MGTETEDGEAVKLLCDKCGNRLEPRCFDIEGTKTYAIFDNCTDLADVQSYDSLAEAIEAFSG